MIALAVVFIWSLWALFDVARTPPEHVTSPGKFLWALLVLVPLAGPLCWLLGGRRETPRAHVPVRPVAPDDDPEFLRRLDRPDSE
jgi:hypothetical protein